MLISYPVNNEGFIDEKELFKIVYGDLSLPYGTIDDITVDELSWINEGRMESEAIKMDKIIIGMINGLFFFESKKSSKNKGNKFNFSFFKLLPHIKEKLKKTEKEKQKEKEELLQVAERSKNFNIHEMIQQANANKKK